MKKIKLKDLKILSFVTDLTDKEKETLNGREAISFYAEFCKTMAVSVFVDGCVYHTKPMPPKPPKPTIVGCYSLAETCEIYCVEPPVQETNNGGPGCQIPG